MASNGKGTAKKQSKTPVTVSITSADGDDSRTTGYYTLEEVAVLQKIQRQVEKALHRRTPSLDKRKDAQGTSAP